jgi:hypothetical protein
VLTYGLELCIAVAVIVDIVPFISRIESQYIGPESGQTPWRAGERANRTLRV